MRKPKLAHVRLGLTAFALLSCGTGCTLGDAVIDGVFGAFSDIIAAVLTSLVTGT